MRPLEKSMSDEFIVFNVITEITAELKMNGLFKCFLSYCSNLLILSAMWLSFRNTKNLS